MTTALDIMKRSLRMLGVYPAGEDLSAEESQDGLTVLNALVAEMSNEQMVYAKTLDSIAIAAGTSSVSVGPSGTTVTTRPAKIESETNFVSGSVTYELKVLTDKQYADIGYKSQSGIPEGVWPLMNMPDITVTLWPVPSVAGTLNLWSTKVLASFPGLTTTVSLPPGYENAFANLLAEAIAPEYEVPVPAVVAEACKRGRRMIARANFQAPMLSVPPELAGGRYNILTGQWL